MELTTEVFVSEVIHRATCAARTKPMLIMIMSFGRGNVSSSFLVFYAVMQMVV